MPKLICMVGIARSGKSTYIDNNLSECQIVCADDIRLAFGTQFYKPIEPFVWAIHDIMVYAYLERRRNICIDSTNTVEDRIIKYAFMADKYKYLFEVVLIDTPIDVCFSRNYGRGSVPKETILKQSDQLLKLKNSGTFNSFKITEYRNI